MKQILLIIVLILSGATIYSQSCSYCDGDTPPTLTASCSGGSGAITYEWTSPTAIVTTGATVSGNENGTWTWECTDENNCTTSGTYVVTIETQPAVNINATDNCEGNSQTISATGVPGGYTYSWNFGDGNPSTSTSATENVTYNSSGLKTIVLTIDNGTCQWVYDLDVTITSLAGSATCN